MIFGVITDGITKALDGFVVIGLFGHLIAPNRQLLHLLLDLFPPTTRHIIPILVVLFVVVVLVVHVLFDRMMTAGGIASLVHRVDRNLVAKHTYDL